MRGELRRKIDSGEPVRGAIIGFNSETVVELAVAAGFDFILIDTEHGSISHESVANMIRAADSFGAEAVVRVGVNARAPIQVALDAGATGVQVPMIETAEDAARVVQFARYAPDGLRGMAGNRAASYQAMNAELTRAANESVVVIPQIETRRGMENAREIAAVRGVDVVFVGPTDLSQSLGVAGNIDAPEVTAAIDEIVRSNSGSKTLGILARSPQSAHAFYNRGFRLFEVAGASLVMSAFAMYAQGTDGFGGDSGSGRPAGLPAGVMGY